MQDHQALDTAIIDAIKDGKTRFRDISSRINTRKNIYGERAIDKRLQALREQKVITYVRQQGDKNGWHMVTKRSS